MNSIQILALATPALVGLLAVIWARVMLHKVRQRKAAEVGFHHPAE